MRGKWYDNMWCPICGTGQGVERVEKHPLPGGKQTCKYTLACGCTVEVVSPAEPKPNPLPMVPCPACGGTLQESVDCNWTLPRGGLAWAMYRLACGHQVEVRAV